VKFSKTGGQTDVAKTEAGMVALFRALASPLAQLMATQTAPKWTRPMPRRLRMSRRTTTDYDA